MEIAKKPEPPAGIRRLLWRLPIQLYDSRDGSYVAASGFGPRADWFQNVLATPDVTIQVGRRTVLATGTPMSAADGAATMARYAQRHPIAAKQLCRIMGFAVDGSVGDYQEAGRHIHLYDLCPARPEHQNQIEPSRMPPLDGSRAPWILHGCRTTESPTATRPG